MAVNAAAAFIAGIVPIPGMWRVKPTAPTSMVLPEASLKEIKNSLSPFLMTPLLFESVAVRLLPTGALLMTLPISMVLFELQVAATNTRAVRTKVIANFFIDFGPF